MTTKEQTILQTFADYFCAGKFEQIPPEVVHKSKLLMIDLVGVAIAGLKMDDPPPSPPTHRPSIPEPPQSVPVPSPQ